MLLLNTVQMLLVDDLSFDKMPNNCLCADLPSPNVSRLSAYARDKMYCFAVCLFILPTLM
jgi:hypothetical protein